LRGTIAEEPFSNYYLNNETLFKIQSDVIRKLAAKGSSLFVGRCADYILSENPRCLNIFISADMNDRIKRIAGIQKMPDDKAKDFIEKTDKKGHHTTILQHKVWEQLNRTIVHQFVNTWN
jgi:cytidylate kinase